MNLASCQLYKILQDEIFEIHVEMTVPIEKIDSDGYWECVAIKAEVSNGAHFLFHSMNTEHAERMLKVGARLQTTILVFLSGASLRHHLNNSAHGSQPLQKLGEIENQGTNRRLAEVDAENV